jgi:Na+/H+-dicarboxylate symporter
MKTVFKKENLFIRIAIGFGVGILLGTLAPEFSIDAKIVGDI